MGSALIFGASILSGCAFFSPNIRFRPSRASRTVSGSSSCPSAANILTGALMPKNSLSPSPLRQRLRTVSSGLPWLIIRPRSITATLSAAGSTCSSLCSVISTATPSSLFILLTASSSSRAASGSSMAVGSSNISSRGSIASAPARFKSCFCPPERAYVLFRNQLSMPKNAAISATRRRITPTLSPMHSRPNASSCHT